MAFSSARLLTPSTSEIKVFPAYFAETERKESDSHLVRALDSVMTVVIMSSQPMNAWKSMVSLGHASRNHFQIYLTLSSLRGVGVEGFTES